MSNNQGIQVIVDMVNGIVSGIHTSTPGKIISYDPGTGRASVQPAVKYKVNDGRMLDAPVIVNVPVYFPSGGSASITYPVHAGDPCWLNFAERAMDDWLIGGESEDPRKYDLTDCAAFVGMKPSRSTNNSAIEIIHGSTKMTIAESGDVSVNTNLNIAGNLSVSGSGGVIVAGDIVAGGISFLSHVHGGVQPGGAKTSVPE